ncbi:hypothetical protein [Vibrio vulnificus]|uniref:hypothetical protein n=1 Tax=Vibrio vulnificus TaxID=672 RepID=UPI0001F5C5B2|nr:hypothetical protein [Vibrio vulnificus]ADV86477.1 hypothetical protein VVMO6_01455 [Vibrio vulnificus MO6-24/O]EGR0037991.1 hypothetical protein [Vibrio vulnificus]EGR0093630.1 hypothetical protein [Vibrio vulnificus]EGR0098077.1 hypothetical protein [Vibrio vulnificus]EGR7943422.1 hypothetical protein [Vibrio vulnificus]
MKKTALEIVKAFVKKWLLSPFSNKVTKILLYTGAAVVAAPMIEHLIIKVILLKFFDINIPIDVPDVPAYVTGVILMTFGAIHNLAYQYLVFIQSKMSEVQKRETEKQQKPHDEKIISEILDLLPYEDANYWLEQAGYAGLRRDFYHNLEKCEKFKTAPFKLYNESVKAAKEMLVNAISDFTLQCMGHLGAQENPKGDMYLPPYHWKSQGAKSEAKYYEQVESVGKAGEAVKLQLDNFISIVKKEGFIV